MIRASFPALFSSGPEETGRMARELARRVYPGLTVMLYGDLGAGKTLFVQSVARALGAGGAKSPSFAIEAQYEGNIPMIHVDLYRLSSKEVPVMELEEHIEDRQLLLIEWAERWTGPPLEDRWDIAIEIEGERERSVSLAAFGERAIQELSEGFASCL